MKDTVVEICPRCKQQHAGLQFTKMTNTGVTGFNYFAVCPVQAQPILSKQPDGRIGGALTR